MTGTGYVSDSRKSQWLVLDLYETVEYHSGRYWICMKHKNITMAGTGSICDSRKSQWQVLNLYVTQEYHNGRYWIYM